MYKNVDEYGDISLTADEIIINEDFIDTGLIDLNGHKLYRRPEKVQIGFHASNSS